MNESEPSTPDEPSWIEPDFGKLLDRFQVALQQAVDADHVNATVERRTAVWDNAEEKRRDILQAVASVKARLAPSEKGETPEFMKSGAIPCPLCGQYKT